MIQISYETYELLLELRDPEAQRMQDTMFDMECHASRYSEGRLDFLFFCQSGSLHMEGRSR